MLGQGQKDIQLVDDGSGKKIPLGPGAASGLAIAAGQKPTASGDRQFIGARSEARRRRL
jgi:hypothetical protein